MLNAEAGGVHKDRHRGAEQREQKKGPMTSDTADTIELLHRAADGDQQAFGIFFRRVRPRFIRLAARICGPGEADDVVQVAFLRLWKELPTLKDISKAEAWLKRTTVNRAIDTLRHIGRRLKIVYDEKHRTVEERFHQPLKKGEISTVFDRAAARLGERQRLAFVLREMEGYSTGETAELMSVTQSTVRNLVFQARNGLRQSLKQMFPEYVPGDES